MKVLVVKGKYATEYYDASTKEALHAAALKVVEGNIDYFYHDQDLENSKHYQDALKSIAEVEVAMEGLSEDSAVRRDLEKALRRAKADKKWREDAQRVYDAAVKAVEDKDGAAALEILYERQNHEYEEWEIVAVWQAS